MENKPHILPGSLLVGMVREKSPGIASGSRFLQQFTKPFEKIFAISIVFKDASASDAPDGDVVQNPGSIKACGSWHVL